MPSQDGTELWIGAGTPQELAGTVFVNVGIGPGHRKGSYTMSYSQTAQTYVATAVGFSPRTTTSAPLNITSTAGIDTGPVEFKREFVPAATLYTVRSVDGNLELTLVTTDTIPHDTYVAVVPSYAPPAPPPAGHRLVGSVYSARAADTLLTTQRPMNLRLYFHELLLSGADPFTLAIFRWDPAASQWVDRGGRLFHDQNYVSTTTQRFATYGLFTTPVWQDDFDGFDGLDLDASHNITLGGGPEERRLTLLTTPGSGAAVSRPITLTDPLAHWETLTFSPTAAPPTTTLTVDVLGANGQELRINAASGTSLAQIDPARHPVLHLRANLTSTAAGFTPSLGQWRLTWQANAHRIYVPTVHRGGRNLQRIRTTAD